MRGVNRVVLIGNLGRDPDVQYLEGNIAVAKFPLATTESYKDKEGRTVSQTEWHTVVLWRGLAELAQRYLHKGSLVFIEGKLKNRNWEDAQKIRRFSTEVVADNLVMLDRKKEGDYSGQPDAGSAGQPENSFSTPSATTASGYSATDSTATAADDETLPF